MLKNEDILIIVCVMIATIGALYLIFTYEKKKVNKKKMISFLPNNNMTNLWGQLLQVKGVGSFIEGLTQGNGMENDSTDAIFAEVRKSALYSIILIVLGLMTSFMFGQIAVIGSIGLGIFFLLWPFIRRMMDKSDYHKKYIEGFYDFLNYITLFLSGGVNMKTALIEVEKLVDEKSVIKPKLKRIISKNAVAGLTGNTYIEALMDLNEGLNFQEITSFINLAKRSIERGDPMSEVLLGQIEDISKRMEIRKRQYISSQETSFEVFKIICCLLPVIVAFAGPILIAALSAL